MIQKVKENACEGVRQSEIMLRGPFALSAALAQIV